VRPRRSARMTASGVDEATAPARWLLDAAAGGVALTQTNALARAVVREAAERWPDWWDAELFGAPHREADLAVLSALHEGLRRLRLVRRRGRWLYAMSPPGFRGDRAVPRVRWSRVSWFRLPGLWC
jgi:hypothetical protein